MKIVGTIMIVVAGIPSLLNLSRYALVLLHVGLGEPERFIYEPERLIRLFAGQPTSLLWVLLGVALILLDRKLNRIGGSA